MMTRKEKNKLRLEKRVSNRREAKKWAVFLIHTLEVILRVINLVHKIGASLGWF